MRRRIKYATPGFIFQVALPICGNKYEVIKSEEIIKRGCKFESNGGRKNCPKLKSPLGIIAGSQEECESF